MKRFILVCLLIISFTYAAYSENVKFTSTETILTIDLDVFLMGAHLEFNYKSDESNGNKIIEATNELIRTSVLGIFVDVVGIYLTRTARDYSMDELKALVDEDPVNNAFTEDILKLIYENPNLSRREVDVVRLELYYKDINWDEMSDTEIPIEN